MIEVNKTKLDVVKGIFKTIFSKYFFLVILWLIYFVGGSCMYFMTNMDYRLEKEYIYIDSHYSYNDGNKKYHFNVIDLSEDDEEDQRQTIDVTKEEYDIQCDQENYCKLETTSYQDFIGVFLIAGAIVLCFIEGGYLENGGYWEYESDY